MSLLPEIERELLRVARHPAERELDDARVRRIRGRAVGRTLVALLLAGGVLAGGLLLVLLHHAGPGNTRAARQLPLESRASIVGAGSVTTHPLTAGVPVSLADARSAVDFPVPLPNTADANPNNLSSTWLDKNGHAVGLVFGNGAVSISMYPVQYSDPNTLFPTLVREVSATASLTQIDGNVAFVIEPRTDPYGPNPAWVELDLNGIDVSLASYTLPLASVEGIANSLASQIGCASCGGAARAKHSSYPRSSPVGSPQHALMVRLGSHPNPVESGHRLVYTITVTNLGADPITDVTARLPLPDGVQWLHWSDNCAGAGPTFSCMFGTLTGHSHRSASITTTVSHRVSSFSAQVTARGTGRSDAVVHATATNRTREKS